MTLITQTFMQTLESYTRRQRATSLIVNMESIAYQKNDKFGPMIEAVVTKYYDMFKSGANRKAMKKAIDLAKEIETLIFARLGLRVKLSVGERLAACLPNVYVPHNAMINSDFRWYYENDTEAGAQDKLNKLKNNTVIGTVNTETVRVTGWFSEQTATLFMNFFDLFKTYRQTPAEVTAIILHELGHIFEGVSFCANVNTTNQVIADIIRHIASSDRGGDAQYIYKKLSAIDKEASMDIANALASGNKVVMNVATHRLIMRTQKTLMSELYYDNTGYEAMSDQFCTRFGYGRHLVTGLEKFEDDYSEYEHSRYVYKDAVFMMVISAAKTLIFGIGAIVAGSPLMVLGSIVFGLITALLFSGQSVTNKNMTYDDIRTRYTRVRSTVVGVLKEDEIDNATRMILLEQIKQIDEIISQKKVFESPLTELNAKLFASDRRAMANIELQKQLELMIANDIFVKATELKLKGSV